MKGFHMSRNLANWDRLIRLVLGLALALGAAFGFLPIWGWVGLILVGTAFMKFCPIYRILGLNTCNNC